jgi:ribosomal protein S18 acetylase RimI-like enzyme
MMRAPGAVVRPAAAADGADVGALVGSPDRAEVRLQAAARGAEDMLVAATPSRIVGAVSIRWSAGCDPPHPWLYGLHVAADVRRRGVGRALMAAAEELARRHGAGHLSLDVDVDEAGAIAFYTALGYFVVRPHRHRWRALDPRTGSVIREGTAPTLIMRRALETPGRPQ